MFSDIHINADCGSNTMVVFIDLSAACDTVDDSILLQHMKNWVCFSDTALSWFKSFAKDQELFCVRRYLDIKDHKTLIQCSLRVHFRGSPIQYRHAHCKSDYKKQKSYHNYADDKTIHGLCHQVTMDPVKHWVNT